MGACSSAALPEAQPSPVKLREEATRAKVPTPPPCAPCAPSVVSGSGGSSDGPGGSAEQIAEALDQEEARQLSLFRAEVRRTSWLSGSASAALPDLSGLWHAEWSRASRRKRAQASDDSAAGGSVAGRLLLVNVVGRGETWSALALGDDAAGELCWQADSTARAMTSFGLPGCAARLSIRSQAWPGRALRPQAQP
jgi:hypothetical protein